MLALSFNNLPFILGAHIISDVVIGACFLAILLLMVFFARKENHVTFPKVFAVFASFILFCGLTHWGDAAEALWPQLWLSTPIRFLTAIVSVATVFALFRVIPQALELRGRKQIEKELDEKTSKLLSLTNRLQEEAARREIVVEDLRENREMLKLAMTEGDTGFFNWDLKSNKFSFDTAQSALTGLDSESKEIQADEYIGHIDPEYQDVFRNAASKSLELSEPFDVRFPFNRPDGTKIWLAGKGCVFHDNQGNPVKIIGLNQDISDQVEREKQLDRQAEDARRANDQKSRFIAQVSHEIRTPLAAMLGCLDSLLMTIDKGDTKEILGIVRSQGELLQVLVNDVLDLSKIEAGKLKYEAKPICVANVFSDVWSLMNPLAQEKGVTIRWTADSKLPEKIVCDHFRLKQVFVNLIGNAIKFTERGAVTIAARLESRTPDEYDLVAEVRDTGCGIPDEKLEAVFEEFEQVGDFRSGYGLGLAICRRLVHLMGGEISVQSEVGKGSTFTVRVPIGQVDQSQLVVLDHISINLKQTPELRQAIERLPLKVLAAEDTRAIQFVLRRMIGSIVDDLDIASNGRIAVEQVIDAESTATPYDLVLMDIQMPELDGIEATRLLRQEGFERPIIALTAGAMESEKQACIDAGCTHFLAKPIDIRELRRLMHSICLEKA